MAKHFAHHMSDEDALMWNIEKDPILRSTIVLVQRGEVARTTSGKVRRSACKQAWLEGRLAVHSET